MHATTNTHPRAEDVRQIIEEHGRAKGLDRDGITWAQLQATNRLHGGMSESGAIRAGFRELDLWLKYFGRINASVADACMQQAVRDAGMEA